METNITVRNAKLSDAPRILDIYTYYVENTVITFEYDVPSLEEFENRMIDIMKSQIENGMPVLATCAGAILLAETIDGQMKGQPEQYFGTIPMCIKRNAYGRQLGSFHTEASVVGIGTVPMTFIRAPYIASVGNGVEVLAVVEERIVGVKYKNQMAFSFHPELDPDMRIHKTFLSMISNV